LTCIPQSGGCEREATDALIRALNALESSAFRHVRCLDVWDRSRPQPEALYEEAETGRRVVIERKAISWPGDYARLHSNDHLVQESIETALEGLEFGALFGLQLPHLIEGHRKDLQEFAGDVADRIRAWLSLAPSLGTSIGSQDPGREWVFRIRPEWEREEDEPETGLVTTWDTTELHTAYQLQPSSLPDQLREALQKLFLSCTRKFAGYSNARTILALDPHGSLRYHGTNWWAEVLRNHRPPCEVGETWLLIEDWLDDWHFGWIAEKIS